MQNDPIPSIVKTSFPTSGIASADLEKAVTEFKGLIDLFDGGEMDQKQFRDAFDRVFIPDIIHTDAKGVVRKADEVYTMLLDLSRLHFTAKVMNLRMLPDESFRYILKADKHDQEMIFRGHAFTEGGKIVRFQQDSLKQRDKCPGQITASNTTRIRGFPNEEGLADSIKSLPPEVRSKLLTDLTPVNELYEVIKIQLHIPLGRRPCASLGRIEIVDSAGAPYAGGYYLEYYTKLFGRRKEFVLYDAENQPIAIGVRDTSAVAGSAFDLLGRHPLHSRDASVKFLDIDFYPWFRVRDALPIKPFVFRPVYVWDGREHVPMMRLFSSDKLSRKRGFLLKSYERDTAYGFLVTNKLGLEVTVAPGTDPAMMILLATAIGSMIHMIK